MRRTCSLGVILLCLVTGISAAYGQGNCSLKTIAGSYAFNFLGSSTLVAGPAADQYHWSARYAPIVGVGIISIKPDGSAASTFWMDSGTFSTGLTSATLPATFTVNPDCTGVLQYPGTAPGQIIQERLVILDNGNEIRSILATAETFTPTNTWISTFRRVGGACTQSKMAGSYLFSCRSLFPTPPGSPIASAAGSALIRVEIARDGSATGTFMGKFGPQVVPPIPVTGSFCMNGDCTAGGTLDFGSGISTARGVIFNEGKEGYWLPLVNDPGAVPQPYGYCDIRQITNR
jgi:hypothetical protein